MYVFLDTVFVHKGLEYIFDSVFYSHIPCMRYTLYKPVIERVYPRCISCRLTYINLLTNGVLNEYLSEIDKQARERFCRIVKKLKTTQGITEQMKANSPMEWVRKMNCVRQQAEEIVIKELLHN